MNRKGHIGTFLMPIIALVLVVNALFVMITFNEDISKARAEIRASTSKMIAEHQLVRFNLNKSISDSILGADKNDFEKTFNESLKDASLKYRTSETNTNLYAKLSLGDYSLTLKDGKYELIVSEVSENYNLDNNEVTYAYSLKAIFDKTKVNSVKVIE